MPCRSALRRARDDTVSELLPLPRRLEAMAFPGTVSRALGDLPVRRKKRRVREPAADAPTLPTEGLNSPMRIAAIALFALAAVFLAYGFAHQPRADSHAPPMSEMRSPEVTPPHSPVSPATLAAEARRSTVLAPLPVAGDTAVESRFADAPPVETIKPRKNPPKASRATVFVDAPVTADPVEVVPIAVATAPPAPKPAAAAVAPDRWQLLAAALARCTGEHLFSRVACEHAARGQYCDGHRGQAAQCPAGVANDHGQ